MVNADILSSIYHIEVTGGSFGGGFANVDLIKDDWIRGLTPQGEEEAIELRSTYRDSEEDWFVYIINVRVFGARWEDCIGVERYIHLPPGFDEYIKKLD